MYVYIKFEPGLWTVGFYDPNGKWVAESDHSSPNDAADRVAYLNGGTATKQKWIDQTLESIHVAGRYAQQ